MVISIVYAQSKLILVAVGDFVRHAIVASRPTILRLIILFGRDT